MRPSCGAEIEHLKAEKQAAVDAEAYEDAAEIKVRIDVAAAAADRADGGRRRSRAADDGDGRARADATDAALNIADIRRGHR